MNATELMKTIKVVKELRKAVINKDKGIYFINPEMCILGEYYIKIADEITITTAKEKLVLSSDFYYYENLKALLEDIYYKRAKKRKIIKRINFLLQRMVKAHSESLDEIEIDYDYLKSYVM